MLKATFWFPAKTRVEQYPEISHIDLGSISGGSSGAEEKGGTGDWGFGYDYESEASGKLSGASLLCGSL